LSTYRVRPAAETDIPEPAAMRGRLRDFLGECDPDLWRLSNQQIAKMAEFCAENIGREDARVFVAADAADRPVGMLMVRIIESAQITPQRFVRIDDAWVEPAHRRKGLMRRLVGHVARFAEQLGTEHALLDYAIRNPDSEEAWQSIGFRPSIIIAHTTTRELLGSKPDA